jgi:hypothetical protein
MSAAIGVKYARVSPWLRPPAEVFRAATRPIHVGVRLHVSARTLRVSTAVPTVTERQQRRVAEAPPVAARLFERATRQTADPVARAATGPVASAAAFAVAGRPAALPSRVPAPIAMVLARATPAAAPAAISVREAHDWRRPDEIRPAPVRAGVHPTEIDGPLTRTDVDRLADRVIGAIDRRMVAARERLHR